MSLTIFLVPQARNLRPAVPPPAPPSLTPPQLQPPPPHRATPPHHPSNAPSAKNASRTRTLSNALQSPTISSASHAPENLSKVKGRPVGTRFTVPVARNAHWQGHLCHGLSCKGRSPPFLAKSSSKSRKNARHRRSLMEMVEFDALVDGQNAVVFYWLLLLRGVIWTGWYVLMKKTILRWYLVFRSILNLFCWWNHP